MHSNYTDKKVKETKNCVFFFTKTNNAKMFYHAARRQIVSNSFRKLHILQSFINLSGLLFSGDNIV